ncbi:hypothetical protein TNCV_4875761 [Trichonephila clavipes]|nr:hypothetical protein TNCV_4875761 [Trichonephila clavipes]
MFYHNVRPHPVLPQIALNDPLHILRRLTRLFFNKSFGFFGPELMFVRFTLVPFEFSGFERCTPPLSDVVPPSSLGKRRDSIEAPPFKVELTWFKVTSSVAKSPRAAEKCDVNQL